MAPLENPSGNSESSKQILLIPAINSFVLMKSRSVRGRQRGNGPKRTRCLELHNKYRLNSARMLIPVRSGFTFLPGKS
jgi:hypothetical protein